MSTNSSPSFSKIRNARNSILLSKERRFGSSSSKLLTKETSQSLRLAKESYGSHALSAAGTTAAAAEQAAAEQAPSPKKTATMKVPSGYSPSRRLLQHFSSHPSRKWNTMEARHKRAHIVRNLSKFPADFRPKIQQAGAWSEHLGPEWFLYKFELAALEFLLEETAWDTPTRWNASIACLSFVLTLFRPPMSDKRDNGHENNNNHDTNESIPQHFSWWTEVWEELVQRSMAQRPLELGFVFHQTPLELLLSSSGDNKAVRWAHDHDAAEPAPPRNARDDQEVLGPTTTIYSFACECLGRDTVEPLIQAQLNTILSPGNSEHRTTVTPSDLLLRAASNPEISLDGLYTLVRRDPAELFKGASVV